jgi:hypothetical protein
MAQHIKPDVILGLVLLLVFCTCWFVPQLGPRGVQADSTSILFRRDLLRRSQYKPSMY